MTDDERDNKIYEIHTMVSVMATELKNHASQTAIHHMPPCEAQKALTTRMWACLLTALGALAAAVYK